MTRPIGGYAHPIPPWRKRCGLISGHRQSASDSEPENLAETQGFEPWIQVLARMLP